MSTQESAVVSQFKKQAAVMFSTVTEVKDLQEAMTYALDVCARKECCDLLDVSGEGKTPVKAVHKTIAAPGLDDADFSRLKEQGEERSFEVIRSGMRMRLAGIDVGFTTADLGIAETGSCVLASENEDVRLSSMVCEVHVVALSKSKIVETLEDSQHYLQTVMEKGTMYTTFVSGSSRTSDIERVLTLGVHGPLDLHIVLLED